MTWMHGRSLTGLILCDFKHYSNTYPNDNGGLSIGYPVGPSRAEIKRSTRR